MKSRIRFFLLFILSLSFLTACGDEVKVIKATIESNEIHKEYTDAPTIKMIEAAVNSTKKEHGAIDVGPSEFKIILDYNDDKTTRYDLHLNIEKGSGYLIRGSLDSLFRLKNKDAKKLIELITK